MKIRFILSFFLVVQDSSICDLVTDYWLSQWLTFDISVFRALQSCHISVMNFLTIDQEEEGAWSDQQEDKYKDKDI